MVTVSGSLDYETAVSHDIMVLATSTDGSSSSEVSQSVTDDQMIISRTQCLSNRSISGE